MGSFRYGCEEVLKMKDSGGHITRDMYLVPPTKFTMVLILCTFCQISNKKKLK